MGVVVTRCPGVLPLGSGRLRYGKVSLRPPDGEDHTPSWYAGGVWHYAGGVFRMQLPLLTITGLSGFSLFPTSMTRLSG